MKRLNKMAWEQNPTHVTELYAALFNQFLNGNCSLVYIVNAQSA